MIKEALLIVTMRHIPAVALISVVVILLVSLAGCNALGQAFFTKSCMDNSDGGVTYLYTDGSKEVFSDSCKEGVFEDHYCTDDRYVRVQYRNC